MITSNVSRPVPAIVNPAPLLPPLKSAIRELAYEHRNRAHVTRITADDARPHIDEDVLLAWWGLQVQQGKPLGEIVEALEQFDERQLGAFGALLIALHPGALRTLHAGLVTHVAGWLAREADTYVLEGRAA